MNIPDDTLLLEPRDVFDSALVGFAHQGGTTMAVYSRYLVIAALVLKEGMSEEDAWDHYGFNVSGSIGLGYPVFMLEDEE